MDDKTALLRDARSVVDGACLGRELFSCLAGSTVWNPPGSDIDILVVLPDRSGRVLAMDMRESFTRAYVDLHASHHRVPDLEWPGEMLMQSDLDAALAAVGSEASDTDRDGATDDSRFDRVWVSMIATGLPLTGPRAFVAAASRCASAVLAVGPGRLPARLGALGLGSGVVGCLHRRASWVSTPLSARERLTPTLCPVPVLEREASRWRLVAAQRWDERSGDY